jgi:hypothetical protein
MALIQSPSNQSHTPPSASADDPNATQRGIDTRLAYAIHRYNVAVDSRKQNPKSDAAKREFAAADEHLREVRKAAADAAMAAYIREA